MENTIYNWKRLNNDVNGNPRYAVHFFTLLKDNEKTVSNYALAVKRANKIGGKKYHNKQFGGGIVFQSYSLRETEKEILNLLINL
jgi:hypothetical protein